MDDKAFDSALVRAAFELAAERGWRAVSVAEAARRADLPLDRARARFPMRAAILMRFGSLADQYALAEAPKEGPHRDRLFDLLMRRFDFLQQHRDGVLALLRTLPADPCTVAFLGLANLRSMAWLLEGAGISARGLRGKLRAEGLLLVFLAGLRAWVDDMSEDLSATMAAVDRALRRAEQAEMWLSGGRGRTAEAPEPPSETMPPAMEPPPEPPPPPPETSPQPPPLPM
jgi:ubiquinone biosynthesis protein COQ9